MEITLPKLLLPAIEKMGLKQSLYANSGIEEEEFILEIDKLTPVQLDGLYDVLKGQPNTRSARVHINAFKRSKSDPLGTKTVVLESMVSALTEYLLQDAIEGWIFQIGEFPNPFMVTGIRYTKRVKAARRGDSDIPAFLRVNVRRISKKGRASSSFDITEDQAQGLTVAEFLTKCGWQKETPELIEQYVESLNIYREFRTMYGKQFRLMVDVDHTVVNKNDRRSRWERQDDPDRTLNLREAGGGRLIQNDELSEGEVKITAHRDSPKIWFALDSSLGDAVEKRYPATEEEGGRSCFVRLPYKLDLDFFHLDQHQEITLHVNAVEVYEYDVAMRAKLILPQDQGELLDTLTEELNLVQHDFVEGKTGGNVILLEGPPGLGKTFSAEAYAEHRRVPLYKIHSGQLGVDVTSIEQELLLVYKRAMGWGCPVLLDEADVFIRSRGNDIVQNAIVAQFLRTLEYQNCTVFMTTNRVQDVDDAILSRCAAIIRFNYPTGDVLKQIWAVQAKQYLPNIPDGVLDEVHDHFTKAEKQMSGRDVKSIMKLAQRYVRTKHNVTTDLFIKCAGFRGV